MFTMNLTRVPLKDRPFAEVRWDGTPLDNSEIYCSVWVIDRIQTAPRQRIAAADLAREWNTLMREKPGLRERMAAVDLDEGWKALAYWVSQPQLGLSLSVDKSESVLCPTCGSVRP